jgi:hypothetical protein
MQSGQKFGDALSSLLFNFSLNTDVNIIPFMLSKVDDATLEPRVNIYFLCLFFP